jgi:hypothetical protein
MKEEGSPVVTKKSDKERTEELVERLNRHPEFLDGVERLLAIADDKAEGAVYADDAEDLIWEELDELGRRSMQDWANRRHDRVVGESEKRRELKKKEKKGSTGTRR